MKLFEIQYLCLEPFLPPLYRQVRKRLRTMTASSAERPSLLDVGGRKSHYQGGVFHRLGFRSWSLRHPWQTVSSMGGNLINSLESLRNRVKDRRQGTRHLMAVAEKLPETGEIAGGFLKGGERARVAPTPAS